MQGIKSTLFIVVLLTYHLAMSQRSVTLQECEEAFLRNNFRLLAEQYNVNASDAMVVQARIWPLPYLSGELNIWNPDDGRFADMGASGQKVIALEQLFLLGNKRRREVELARSNAALARIQFEDLLRNLRYELRASFYSLYFERLKLGSLDRQVNHVDTLYQAYAVQAERGNVSLRESVRLQSLAWNLRAEMQEVLRNLMNEQETLALLTGFETELEAVIVERDLNALLIRRPLLRKEELQSRAKENNPALRFAKELEKNNELNLRWQKSLATPDLTLGGAYDQRGGAFNNQVNLTFGIPLPVWNQNKGRIRAAEAGVEYARLGVKHSEQELAIQLDMSYRSWELFSLQYAALRSSEVESLRTVYEGVIANFQKRNISLFEFTDFMESYNKSIQNLNEARKQLVLSSEQINYLVSDEVF